MPWRRYSRYGKRGYSSSRQKAPFRRWRTNGGAGAARSLVCYRPFKQETKYKDTTLIAAEVCYDDVNFYRTTDINTGSGQGQRIANAITKRALRLNYCIVANSGSTHGAVIRVMVVEDRHCNKTALTSAQLGAALLTDPTTADAIISPAIPENYSRFKIWYDMQHMISPATGGDLGAVPHTVVIKMGTTSVYTGTTCSDASTMTEGCVYIWVTSNVASSDTTNKPAWSGIARLTYNDA